MSYRRRRKPRFTKTVTALEMSNALAAWHRIMNIQRGTFQYSNPWSFFGRKEIQAADSQYLYKVSDKAYQKIMILNHPNARFMLKVWAARTGYKRKIPNE